jgi:hypothetical protein
MEWTDSEGVPFARGIVLISEKPWIKRNFLVKAGHRFFALRDLGR